MSKTASKTGQPVAKSGTTGLTRSVKTIRFLIGNTRTGHNHRYAATRESTMKAINAIKKIKSHFKKQGINIEISPPRQGGSYKWTFQHGDYVGSFAPNGHNGYSEGWEDADTSGFHVRHSNDHSDIQSDYFAGSYRSNISQVCDALLPSPPKYPVGSLVRGKQTKRAQRYGFAGKVGLVMGASSNSNITVNWLGDEKPNYGYQSFSSRDLEIAN